MSKHANNFENELTKATTILKHHNKPVTLTNRLLVILGQHSHKPVYLDDITGRIIYYTSHHKFEINYDPELADEPTKSLAFGLLTFNDGPFINESPDNYEDALLKYDTKDSLIH